MKGGRLDSFSRDGQGPLCYYMPSTLPRPQLSYVTTKSRQGYSCQSGILWIPFLQICRNGDWSVRSSESPTLKVGLAVIGSSHASGSAEEGVHLHRPGVRVLDPALHVLVTPTHDSIVKESVRYNAPYHFTGSRDIY